MPLEEKFIKFTLNEVIEALRAISDRGQFELPKTSVISAQEITLPDGLATELTFIGADKPVVLKNTMIAAALIGYCSRFQIPIPKSANKSIGVSSNSVMLRISPFATDSSNRNTKVLINTENDDEVLL